MQEWVVSATAQDHADQETAADVGRFLERRGALGVFTLVLGAGLLRVVFRWRALSREGAERDAADLVRAAMAVGGHGGDVRAVAR